jgi:hypothetical protein
MNRNILKIFNPVMKFLELILSFYSVKFKYTNLSNYHFLVRPASMEFFPPAFLFNVNIRQRPIAMPDI